MKKTFSLLTTVLILLVGLGLFAQPAWAQVLRSTYAGGASHSLSIHADGTLWATGNNQYGQLGIGGATNQSAWTQVGTATTWVQVAAGQNHSLALQADGTLYAWGRNNNGQLGIGSLSNSDAPVAVAGGPYVQVAVGSNHSLALKADGTLYTWGDNFYSQLGDGTATNRQSPTLVSGGGTYKAIAAGLYHSLGLRTDGTLYAWGSNLNGQLGSTDVANGNSTPVFVPKAVSGSFRFVKIAAGLYHSLGLQADGSLYAWGNNQYGQLGNNSASTSAGGFNYVPTLVPGGAYVQIAASSYQSLGVRATGSLYAWGNNQNGQLGTTANNAVNFTPQVVAGGVYTQVAAGGSHSLGLKADGNLYTWGSNQNGQLGSTIGFGTTTPNPTPVATGQALNTRSTAMGANFGLAIKGDGTLWAWGDNAYGQLGDGTTAPQLRPVQIGTDRDWVQVAAGTTYSLGLKADGTLYTWGDNYFGQLGNSTNTTSTTANPTPTQVPGTYAQVAAGSTHSLALKADGTLYAWGDNYYGQLGSSTNTTSSAANPTPAQAGPGVYASLAAGAAHSLALKADGTLFAWGKNQDGQLGTSTTNTTPNPVPTQVGTATYIRLAGGGAHSLALRADGTLYAWGQNAHGELGTGTMAATTTPTQVGTASYTQLAAGHSHSLALRADGTLYTWGYGQYGQLGSGGGSDSSTPMQEATLGTGWTTLAPGRGSNASLVRTASAQNIASAGANSSGQLGDGTTTDANRFDRLIPLSTTIPLPVELLSFKAWRTAPATVRLTWATASEMDNAGFGIEKSSDGTRYVRLGFVAATGGSTTEGSYTYQDEAATEAAYYRLAQTDHDGTISYSPMQYVPADESGAAPQLVLVPNPTQGAVRALGLPAGATLCVYNSLGQCVRPAATALDVAGLPAGVYLVRATGPGPQPRPARLTVN